MDNETNEKLINLRSIISQYPSAVIAFSGGVDSTLLAKVAKQVCNNVKLITVSFSAIPNFELIESRQLANEMELPHEIIDVDEMDIPEFLNNNADRCYHCKKHLFSTLKECALRENFHVVLDGTNADDTKDYRPGRKALKELEIVSPLRDAGLTKREIRMISRELGLNTGSKPAYACLASRFPYKEKLTREKLQRVGNSEAGIRKLGFTQFRVRSHDNTARIEFIPEEMHNAWKLRKDIENICRHNGFIYVALDTTGYRVGAMNEALSEEEIEQY